MDSLIITANCQAVLSLGEPIADCEERCSIENTSGVAENALPETEANVHFLWFRPVLSLLPVLHCFTQVEMKFLGQIESIFNIALQAAHL